MSILEGIGLHIKNYKCFFEDPQGLEAVRPINIIIGRNNSGKSSLIEMIELATLKDRHKEKNSPRTPTLVLTKNLTSAELGRVFQKGWHGGDIPGHDHWQSFGSKYVDVRISFEITPEGKKFIEMERQLELHPNVRKKYEDQLANSLGNAFEALIFKRLNAERNISPESESHENLLRSDGYGFTNLVRRFINMDSLPSEMVEKTLLKEINKIVEPDMSFTDIVVQQSQRTTQWEIYLEEEKKGRIPLGNSGSGIKTIFLVLGFLHLIPYIENKKLDKYIFCFEELENNLHPALQRRLLMYLNNMVEEHDFTLVMTTHSSVLIDLFSANPLAQITHVTHDGERGVARKTKAYFDYKGILSDLDIRASDLLQSNCIIWVEGPSDRIYVNRWIELYSKGTIREGAHYQCVFYGGRLLAHLTASSPDEIESAISILRVNRNAIIVIDSDRTRNRTEINETKKRLQQEVQSGEGFAWITEGREIENYIPNIVLDRVLNIQNLQKVEKWSNVFDVIESAEAELGKNLERSKVLFAERIAKNYSLEDMDSAFDLKIRISDIIGKIRLWNSLPTPASQQ